MNEQQISALADGEKLEEGIEMTISNEIQARWTEYHQIGEILRAVRTEVPTPLSDNFQKRFAAAFEAEQPHAPKSSAIARLTKNVVPFMHQIWSTIVHPMRA
jgi:negative regulator of sigma E activity